ncbi:hypothetical protein N7510_005414 [Penicillium lagena]|uniref:uncharacterized protein n=1 Tax=Penicillium lagena TaxID=94218 RepID=UPI0025409CE0|nr:uncharacterized protein N7510_005414 [Penicillium lagena]KAJ5612220.1 hypothetical protein N7510_005414 [Penicillium lagena]
MELIIHLMLDNDVFCLGLAEIDFHHHTATSLLLKKGLEYPYLLHEMLAFSSLHLASMRPAKSISYQQQAMALQTRAVSLFNSYWTEIDETNCVGILLFSSVLGHHLLADTIANQDIGALDCFMAKYLHCVEIHRGIHTLAMSAWPQLMKSELEPILSASSRFTSRSPRGSDCEDISGLISDSQGLGDEDKEACQLVIRNLQIGFDAVSTELGQGYRHYMIYTWLMLAPSRFISLLSAKKPEALILLAFYAALLHHGRQLWQVKNAGIFIFRMINEYLDPMWHHWLQYPRRIMSQDLH